MTPALLEFLKELRDRNVTTRDRIQLFRDGTLALHEVTAGGQYIDISDQAIARDEAEVAANERLFALHDPEGLSV
jgi:hypothetical protein